MSSKRAKQIRSYINYNKQTADQMEHRFYRILKRVSWRVESHELPAFCRMALRDFDKQRENQLTNSVDTL